MNFMLRRLRDYVRLYSSLMRDPRVPARARSAPWIALAYLVFPLDIVPDLLPVIGQLDDLLVIGMLFWLAASGIADGLYAEHRRRNAA